MAIGGGYWDMLRAGPGWQDLAQAVQSGLARRDRRQMAEDEAQQAAADNKAKLDQFRAQQDAAKQEADAKRRANVQWVVGNRLARDPSEQTLDWARKTLEENNAAEGFDLSQYTQTFEPSPDAPGGEIQRQIPRSQQDIAGVAESMRVRSQGVLGPQREAQEDQPLDDIARQVILGQGLRPGQPGFADAYRKAMEQEEKNRLSRASAGAAKISVGQDLTGANQTAQQKAVMDADLRLRQINEIKDSIAKVGGPDAYAQYGAEVMQEARGIGSKLGIDVDREAVKERARVRGAIGAFSNQIINELSGAAVSESEMKRIRQSLPMEDDPGPVLEAKLEAWTNNLQLIRDYGVGVLEGGIKSGKIKLPGSSSSQLTAEQRRKLNQHVANAPSQQAGIEAAVAADDISREQADDLLKRLQGAK